MGRPTYEAPTREYRHTNTHKHKQTHNLARQSTVRTHAVAAPSSSEKGASPPPPASCISVAISHARRSYVHRMCTATDRRCACSASHVDVDQLTSFSYCRFLSLFRTLSCIRRKSRTTGSLQPSVSDLPEFSRDFDGFDSILKWDGISGMEVVFDSLIFLAVFIV